MKGARLLGHPVHPMLTVFVLGMLISAALFDLFYVITHDASWPPMAYWNIGVGVPVGLIAAVFGVWDWLTLPAGSRPRTVGSWHGGVNLTMLLLFGSSWMLRRGQPDQIPGAAALTLSFAAALLAAVGTWLGVLLVERHGVGDNLTPPLAEASPEQRASSRTRRGE